MPDGRTTFAIVLPPGWVRLAVDDQTERSIRRLVADAVAAAPPEQAVEVRSFLRRTIDRAVRQARERRATDLILCHPQSGSAPVPASIVVARQPNPASASGSADQDARQQLIALAMKQNSSVIDIDGYVAVRREKFGAASDESPAHRAVSYAAYLPADDEWIVFTASVLWSDDPEIQPVLDAVQLLIDTMISTVRFQPAEVTA